MPDEPIEEEPKPKNWFLDVLNIFALGVVSKIMYECLKYFFG